MGPRRLTALSSLFATLLVAALGVAPAAAATTYHVAFSGTGAEGFWSSYPPDGQITAGVVYRDTYLASATQGVRADGSSATSTSLFFYSLAYTFDRKGNFITVSDLSAWIGGASLTIDGKLTIATAAAGGTGTLCTFGSKGSVNCVDIPIVATASWTGQGPLVRSHGTSTGGVAGEYQSTFHGTYIARSAIAQASLVAAGSTIDIGANAASDMFSFQQGENDVTICSKGC